MMKKRTILPILLTGVMLGWGVTDLQARGRNNNTTGTSSSQTHRPTSSNKPSGNNGNNRPGGNNGNHNGNNRPGGNNGNHNGNNRPGGNNYNPGHNNNHNNYNPGHNNNHGYKPGHGPTVPHRPHVPPHYHYCRPTPPPGWRYSGHGPSFGTLLGMAIGSALNNSINYLLSNGYNVAGYGSNEIYLNNVYQYGYNWPNGTMYFVNGRLSGTSLAWSTWGYDMSRYNGVYNMLMGQYGYPISVQNLNNGGVTATWWGRNNSFIELSYYPEYNYNGSINYFTTLSFGN